MLLSPMVDDIHPPSPTNHLSLSGAPVLSPPRTPGWYLIVWCDAVMAISCFCLYIDLLHVSDHSESFPTDFSTLYTTAFRRCAVSFNACRIAHSIIFQFGLFLHERAVVKAKGADFVIGSVNVGNDPCTSSVGPRASDKLRTRVLLVTFQTSRYRSVIRRVEKFL